MRVLFLCRALGIGGTERQLIALAKGLYARGDRVAVAVFYADGPLEQELRTSAIPVLNLRKAGRWDALFFFVRLVRLIRRHAPEIVYAFLGTPNILAVLVKPFCPGIKIVWGVRASNVDLTRYDWLARLLYRGECALSFGADLIICNSHAGLEYAAAHGFPRRKMITIPNGIDTERFQPDRAGRTRVRNEWGVAEGEILIGLAGRLDPMKDQLTFLRAAAMFARERREVRFVCVGDGADPYKTALHRLANELGLGKKVIWAGERADMPAVYSALDISCSSSYTEGFSNAIGEAMACGVPCVVTDVGDSALIVGTTGEVVPSAAPEALCHGFRRMRERLGPGVSAAARAAVVTRFTNELAVTNTADALGRLCRRETP